MTATAAAPAMVDTLLAKGKDRTALFGVVGLGYVGLPLAMELVRAGYRVLGVDVNPRVVDSLNAGRSHIQDVPAATVANAVQAKKFSATADLTRLKDPDVISISVPTPLSKTKDPDVSYVLAATESVKRALRKGQLVVLESTTYPGTTRELMLPALESTGLKVGEDFFLAFSPERVDPGNERFNTRNTPKVVGGITPNCLKVALALYQPAIDTLVPVSSPEAAELVKILENTFRSVNIGLVNEMAIVCDKLGVDVWEVIDAAATKPFGFMKFTPGPGVGGHCIPLDPHYLAWKMRTLNYKTRFIELAGELNAEMPEFWVAKVVDALNDQGKAVRGSRVLLLGVAYKKNVDDIRESPALDVIRLLQHRGAQVSYHDPHVSVLKDDGIALNSVALTPETLRAADCVMIITDHNAVDYAAVKRHARATVDTRHVLSRERKAERT
ncbi:MAG: UDP-N-acetyl-D-glucosamine dehydrogenase [Gemmatimonadetes bacterium]|nr:MAG: UDP-N-acetyl-D-glucosamine dehydrogenase [Gemmatimonadetes bacterium 13_2_20CM_2_66_5]OLC86369.1 MAG: UDP-N-acetyl-D-glucosamine dehydrogenase [Gemmatimonadetes bacterium 13_1_40CM_3_66_12]OLD86943.1 MAG: UDP-N-acetyl-D-glucosamine dehydrogenase [Gemmatimonadetes bacterium 13_1_20CM_4_66_11]PYP95390.1 MAG: UDP-N-acetyl-D-glucosamine dehydrogenase [Gemmatimonadota bacterium]